ncbi:hypothetical protein EVG20_g10352, partial [Dentipellis fragilis]
MDAVYTKLFMALNAQAVRTALAFSGAMVYDQPLLVERWRWAIFQNIGLPAARLRDLHGDRRRNLYAPSHPVGLLLLETDSGGYNKLNIMWWAESVATSTIENPSILAQYPLLDTEPGITYWWQEMVTTPFKRPVASSGCV